MPDGDTAYWLSSPEGQSAPTDLSQRQPLESLEIIHVKMAIQEMNNRLKNYLKDRIRNLIKFNDNEEQIELLNDHLMGNYGFLQESPFPFIPAKL